MKYLTGEIDNDWHSKTVPLCFFKLNIQDEQICFSGGSYSSPYVFENLEPGFHKDLWKRNVIELFLADKSGKYHEFNFAPNSTWWYSSFSAPRIQSESEKFKIDLSINNSVNFWEINAVIPFKTEDLDKFNVAWIVMNPLQYVSYTKLPGDEPNFHQPEYFKDL